MRVGMGYDVHRLVEGRKLIIGGVEIPYEKGLLGHSDADVLLHAIMDALLGAAALGDIGKHFPDTDERYKGADSMKLLSEVKRLLEEKLYIIENIDATVIAQSPKMAPYIDQMRENICNCLCIDKDQVNIKATTEEKLGFTGGGLGISSQAVCLIESAFGAAMFVQGFGSIGFLVAIAGAVVFGIFVSRRETEYEYIMVNEDIDIARIIAKKSRKKIMSFSNADVKFIAKEGCIYLDNELQQDSSIKTRDFTSGNKQNQDGVYVFVLNKNGKAEFVKLELSDRTIDHVNNFFRGKYKE